MCGNELGRGPREGQGQPRISQTADRKGGALRGRGRSGTPGGTGTDDGGIVSHGHALHGK